MVYSLSLSDKANAGVKPPERTACPDNYRDQPANGQSVLDAHYFLYQSNFDCDSTFQNVPVSKSLNMYSNNLIADSSGERYATTIHTLNKETIHCRV